MSGLAVGFASCILIFLYVNDELTFDRFHDSYPQLYRVVESETTSDREVQHVAGTAGVVGPLLDSELPDVVNHVRLVGRSVVGRRTLERGAVRFYEEYYYFTDPSFFELFDFTWMRGDPSTALVAPQSMVLTEEAARQYFGAENPVGKTLNMEQWGEMTVTGVLENPPHHSHLDFRMLISYPTFEGHPRWQEWLDSWDSGGIVTYLQLREGAERAGMEEQITGVMERYQTDAFAETKSLSLQRLADIHFGSRHIVYEENAREGNRAYLYIFSAIALFTLLIASMNYVNLATAQATQRAQEVGVRKVLGAHREQLMQQFLGESVVLAGLALILGGILSVAALPLFNELTGKDISKWIFLDGRVIAVFLGLTLSVGFLAGFYPALYLGQFMPVRVLKGGTTRVRSAARVRKGLVITQFALSIGLLIATLVIGDQLRHIQDKQLGFNKEAIVVVDINSGEARSNFQTMKHEFASHASVRRVSVSSRIPGDWKTIPKVDVVRAAESSEFVERMYFIGADADFVDTYEMDMVSGRYFSEEFGLDSTAVVLNETGARALGITEAAGQVIRIPLDEEGEDAAPYDVRVIGIAEDFHFQSLHEPIAPLVLGYRSNPIDVIDYYSIHVETSELASTLAHLRSVGESFDTEHPFEYNFLDDRLNDFYVSEQRVSRLFNLAAVFSVFIACLGLWGLASFMATQRQKEIGVRKVLGATTSDMVILVSKEYVRLVLIALVVASPVALWVMQQWLSSFAYRTAVDWWIFPVVGVITLSIALLTVSAQSIKVAAANPVDTLHYE